MGKWEKKPPTKKALAYAEAVFKQTSATRMRDAALRDLQETEATQLREKTERLRALRLAKADAKMQEASEK